MFSNKKLCGHLAAILCIAVWGTTFTTTKIILQFLNPFSILVFRFVIGYIALWILYPHFKKAISFRDELPFLLAGLTGVTMYLMIENTAIQYSTASNVGVIVSSAPMFTALFFTFVFKKEKILTNFILGFFVAIFGIALVMFKDGFDIKLHPKGDLLAVLAAMSWGIYSVFYKMISDKQLNVLFITRRIFFYSLLTMIPLGFLFPLKFSDALWTNPTLLGNLLFLGVLASACCYALWSFSCNQLGAVKTSVYIYLSPFVTILTSMLVLGEKMNFRSTMGCFLILAGLVISDRDPLKKQENK